MQVTIDAAGIVAHLLLVLHRTLPFKVAQQTLDDDIRCRRLVGLVVQSDSQQVVLVPCVFRLCPHLYFQRVEHCKSRRRVTVAHMLYLVEPVHHSTLLAGNKEQNKQKPSA